MGERGKPSGQIDTCPTTHGHASSGNEMPPISEPLMILPPMILPTSIIYSHNHAENPKLDGCMHDDGLAHLI